MLGVAIIIVNYNTRDLPATCLQSVYANRTEHEYHVIVVDNVANDGSAEMVAARYPQATLIKSDRSGGFGYANNRGLRSTGNSRDIGAWFVVNPTSLYCHF
jgi:GT2 family glycosyltransferase